MSKHIIVDAAMYEGDSFYTLSTAGQAGLISLSAALAAGVFWLAGILLHYWRWHTTPGRYAGAVATALVIFWVFMWLSPQVYYTYYLFLIDTLPWQSVISSPPGVIEFLKLMTFRGHDNLATHMQAALGWVLIGHTVTTTYRRGGH